MLSYGYNNLTFFSENCWSLFFIVKSGRYRDLIIFPKEMLNSFWKMLQVIDVTV